MTISTKGAKSRREDPFLPVDEEARRLAMTLLREARSAALATLEADGQPFASLTGLAVDEDGTPVILISSLAAHTGHLMRDPRASLLLAAGGKGDPLAHPRLTLSVRAEAVERDSAAGQRIRQRYLDQHPKARLYVDFGDFRFLRLVIVRASLNGGFGKAYQLGAADFQRLPGA